MSKTVLYGKTRTGKTKIWSTWVVEKGESGYPEAHCEWGMIDGKKQLSIDIVKKGVNEGKANETTPLEQARLEIERKAKKKIEEGYLETLDSVDDQEQTIDFSKPFQKELCFYKPKNSIDDKKIAKLEANRSAVYTVKRDGMMHVVRKTKEFGVEIYSRRMDVVTAKYPHLVEALECVPYNFVLLGEIILDKGGKDNFNAVSSICRSDPEKAIERQEELGYVKYYVFDMAYMSGKGGSPWLPCLLTNETYISRLDLFESNIECHLDDDAPVQLCEILNYDESKIEVPLPERRTDITHKEALDIIKERGLEGLVIWNANAKMKEGEAFVWSGKAYRPSCLWKSKPRYELDAIARFDPDHNIGEYGIGKNNGKMKSVFLYQLDDEGNEIYISKCGGGFTDQQREYYTSAKYPKVFRILYDSIQKDGSLRFPVFDIEREDKTANECFLEDEIKKAKNIK